MRQPSNARIFAIAPTVLLNAAAKPLKPAKKLNGSASRQQMIFLASPKNSPVFWNRDKSAYPSLRLLFLNLFLSRYDRHILSFANSS